mmetsp:Transcript_4214/g.10132  ORF Transcript_4214/g.10132 Transcript_4214/m.10132 type:complete len:109 (+) Transcript_4214:1747-2073(+)
MPPPPVLKAVEVLELASESEEGGYDSHDDFFNGVGIYLEWDCFKLAAYQAADRLKLLVHNPLFKGLDQGVFEMIDEMAHGDSWDFMPTIEWAYGPGPPFQSGSGEEEY